MAVTALAGLLIIASVIGIAVSVVKGKKTETVSEKSGEVSGNSGNAGGPVIILNEDADVNKSGQAADTKPGNTETGNAETEEAAGRLFDLINEIRKTEGLQELEWTEGMEEAAKTRASEASEVWSHFRPDGSKYYTVNEDLVYGESLARSFTTADETLNAWLGYPKDRDNIDFPDYKTAAAAVCIKDGVWYWAMLFGY